jgi:hypothetical protein
VFPQELSFLRDSKARDYIILTDLLGVPRNNKKDVIGQTVIVIGYTLDILLFELRILEEKLNIIRSLLINVLRRRSLRLWDVQVLAGYLA